VTIEATSALGGSASSQADTLGKSAWTPRASVALLIRAVTFALPIVASVLAVWICSALVPAPDDRIARWIWIAGLVAVSCVASFGAQRALRKLAPLGLLFTMSLVFPDEAPTRFGLALRTGTFRSLARRVRRADAAAGDVWTVQRWAEHLVAAMGRLNRHDRLTAGHSERVRAYSVMLGQEIGLSPDDLDRLNWAALIHDIGKLDVPSEILCKPDRPTPQEWSILRGHPGAGWRYVDPLRPWLGDWVDAATQHHERWDGRGYPLGLAGNDISLAGRIVAIADAFDVMTAARSYKKPLPAAQARAELTLNSGTQFDPQLVRSFLQISLGRMRRVIGPLGVLAYFPDFLRLPLTAALSSSRAVVLAGAVAVGTAAGVVAPDALPPEESSMVVDAQEPTGLPSPEPAGTLATTPAEIPPAAAVPDPATLDPTLDATLDPDPDPTPDPAIPAPPAPAPTTAPAAPSAPADPAIASVDPPAPAPTIAPAPPEGQGSAVDDSAPTRANQKVSVHVLDNDDFGGTDIDIATLTITIDPTHGNVKVAGENLLYEPAPGFVGIDTMTYQVCSVTGVCDLATVTVTVT
jgi:hypothetical protein